MRYADVTPAERAIWILDNLYQGRELTVDQAAQSCQVSTRTVYRDLLVIERMVAIEREAGVIRLLQPTNS